MAAPEEIAARSAAMVGGFSWFMKKQQQDRDEGDEPVGDQPLSE